MALKFLNERKKSFILQFLSKTKYNIQYSCIYNLDFIH